jgi:electron transfer flavoprotein beta subunit
VQIAVCVKQVPEVADADLELTADGTDVEREELVLDLNEWDVYAVEEAIRLSDSCGGSVTVVTVGDDEAEEALHRALAMGAERAIRVATEGFEGSDATGIARALCRVIRKLDVDLVLTGAQSSDTGWGQVGVTLAGLLDLPHASLAVAVRVEGERVVVRRELESSALAEVQVDLPAVITVQTGINEPRYVSVTGIRRARGVRIEETDAGRLGLGENEIGHDGSIVAATRLSLPERREGAEILSGKPEQVCDRLAEIIRDRGGAG